METSEFHNENNEAVVPEDILSMYKIDGREKVEYESYLWSKQQFESEVVHSGEGKENQNTILKTKNEILGSSGDQATALIIKALQSTDIGIQRVGASLVQQAPETQRQDLEALANKKIEEAIHNEDIRAQRLAAVMIQYASSDKQD